MRRTIVVTLWTIGAMANAAPATTGGGKVAGEVEIREVDVATLPHPGTAVPGAIQFSSDSRSVYFLKSEDRSLNRSLWKAIVGRDARAEVIARAPGGGDTDANVSREEALRRERQRLRDTGIAQVARAEDVDAFAVPIKGDIFVLEPGKPLRRLTKTAGAEIDPRPSPDGSRVAFARDGELFVIDAAGGRETTLTRGAADGLSHGQAEFIAQEELGRSSGYWWSPDGSKIAYQQTDERDVPTFAIAHQDGAEYSVETHRYPFAGKRNATVRLGVVSTTGGPTTWLKLAEPREDFYLARVDWDGPGALLVQILSRDQKSLRLVRLDVSSGEKSTLLEERSDRFVNLHNDLRIVPKTGELIWSSERTGFRHLELRDRDGTLIRTLTSGDWPVDAVAGLDAKRREVWFAAGRESPLEAHLYRVSLDGGPVRRLTRETGTHRAVVAPDGDHFADTFSDLATPPVTTIRDRDGEILAILDDASEDPNVARLGLGAPQLTEFKHKSGQVLHGAYYAPSAPARSGGKRPLIVMVYGGPHVQAVTNSWGMTADLTAQFLASKGFAVCKLDNRGSSRRGLAFESAIYRNMGDLEVRDQVEGVKFLAASHSEVDPSRVGITGGSYGGYMTLRALELAPETFRAGVAVAPVTDWDGYDTGYTERYMETPETNAEGYAASSVLGRVDGLRGRLLVIHGMLDENVHFRHSARLATALIAAGKPFELLPIPNERHSSRKVPERTYIARRLAEFFTSALLD